MCYNLEFLSWHVQKRMEHENSHDYGFLGSVEIMGKLF